MNFHTDEILGHTMCPRRRARKAAAGATFPILSQHTAVSHCTFCGSPARVPEYRLGQIVACPHCGMETLACDSRVERANAAERHLMEIRRLDWERGQFGVRYIVGEITNRSAGDLAWVRIEFVLCDEEDGRIGAASDLRRGLGRGMRWNFRVPVLRREAMRAALADVTCEYGSVYDPVTACCASVIALGAVGRRRDQTGDVFLGVLPQFA